MMGDCLSFKVTKISLSNFGVSNCESSDSDVSDCVKRINTDVKYYEWSRRWQPRKENNSRGDKLKF